VTNTSTTIARAIFCLALLTACDQDAALKRFTLPQHDRLARNFITAVRTGDTALIQKTMAPRTHQIPGVMDSLRAAAAVLPQGPIDTLRQIGVNRVRTNGAERSLLQYELHTPAGWGIVDINVIEEGGVRYVAGIRTDSLPASLESINAFRLTGKNPVTFVVPLLAFGFAVLSLAVAVSATRTTMPRRWLWALLALLGVAPVTLNWTTGQLFFQLFSVVLLSAGFNRVGPGGPWLISVGFPIGVVATLSRIRRARNEKATPEDRIQTAAPIAPAS
jgi:hypothetical protein